MIRRYAFASGDFIVGARFNGNSLTSETRVSALYNVNLKGNAGATVTVTVQMLTSSYPTYGKLQVDGVTKVLGDTISVLLNGSGEASIAVRIGYSSGGVPDGEYSETNLEITAVTSGQVGAPNLLYLIKTVG